MKLVKLLKNSKWWFNGGGSKKHALSTIIMRSTTMFIRNAMIIPKTSLPL